MYVPEFIPVKTFSTPAVVLKDALPATDNVAVGLIMFTPSSPKELKTKNFKDAPPSSEVAKPIAPGTAPGATGLFESVSTLANKALENL